MKLPSSAEVTPDGSILFNGKVVGWTNNIEEVRKRLKRGK